MNNLESSKNFALLIAKNETSYKAFVSKFPNIIENIKSLGIKDPGAKKSVLPTFNRLLEQSRKK